MEDLNKFVGRKVKGVQFGEYDNITFASHMRAFVGVEGIIEDYCARNHSFRIAFNRGNEWYYPVELILPQLSGELVGYVINDEKYIKIIASLCDMDESLLKKTYDNVQFHVSSDVEEVVKKFDLLDKCTPVYKEVELPKLPVINGFHGEDKGDYLKYGCAQLPKSWFTKSSNRSIKSMTLNSGVVINKEQMSEIRNYLDSSKNKHKKSK